MPKEKIQLKKRIQLKEKVRSPKENGFPTGQAEGIARAASVIKETLGKEGEIIKAEKTDGGWEIEIEVVEQSEYMKQIGIPKPVYDKNVYRVLLDRNFELVSFERKSQKPSGGAAE